LAKVIEEELKGLSVSAEGFDSHLGAPFSIRKHHGRAKQLALELVQSLRQELDNISYLQDPQLEFMILKYCFCPKINHLCRLLPHDVLAPAIVEFDKLLKSGLASCTKAPTIPDDALEQAKQPVRNIGLGLGDVSLIAPAAYAAAHSDTATILSELRTTSTEDYSAEGVHHTVQKPIDQLSVDESLIDSIQAYHDRTPGAHNPLCPAAVDIQKAPSQKTLSEPLYDAKSKDIIASHSGNRRRHAWLHDCSAFGAGAWAQAVPSSWYFREKKVFGIMVLMYLFLPIPGASGLVACPKCLDSSGDSTFKCKGPNGALDPAKKKALAHGYHFFSKCKANLNVVRHDKVRDLIHLHMYPHLGVMHTQREPEGLYHTSDGNHRPADVLVPRGVHDTSKDLALDVATVRPDSGMEGRPGAVLAPLYHADVTYDTKMKAHAKVMGKAGLTENQITWKKVPLVFSLTGGFQKAAEKWFMKQVVPLWHKQNGHNALSTLGEPHTWSANSFKTFWLQRISMTLAREAALVVHIALSKAERHHFA
jgi:hypothetical protein